MKDWYFGTPLHDEYKHEIKQRFGTNKVAGFVEDLRNYALHYQLPITAAHLQVTRESLTDQYIEQAAYIPNAR